MHSEDLKRFLIVNPFGIGDVLFTTPLVRAIKQAYPDSYIGYWCNERVKDVLKNNPNINAVFALSRGDIKRISKESKLKAIKLGLKLLGDLKKGKFQVSIDFTLDHRYGLVEKLLGIKKRLGFDYKSRGRFLTHKLEIDGYNSKHVVEYYTDLLKFLDITAKDKNLELLVNKESNQKAKSILRRFGINDSDLIVGIAPGAGASWGKNAATKHWSAIKFAQLADSLINEFNAKVVILGSDAEKNISEAIMYSMKNKAVDLVGKTSLEDLFGIINNLHLLIANDGGVLHTAVALGKKTVSVFGPVDEVVYGPYPVSSSHEVVKKDIECRPCYKRFRLGVCERNKECLNSITTGEVFEAVRRIW